MTKRHKRPRPGRWEPGPGDAINLATIRWFALMMEAKAIEIYGTNPAVYPKLAEVLGNCLRAVDAVNPKKPLSDSDEGECPPGWVPCGEDCAPICMSE